MTEQEEIIPPSQKSLQFQLCNQNPSELNDLFLQQNQNNFITSPYTSPIFLYFNCNRIYLHRKFCNSSNINFKYSNNYILKDSLIQNDEAKNNDNSEDDDVNSEQTNEISQNLTKEDHNCYYKENSEGEYLNKMERMFLNSNYNINNFNFDNTNLFHRPLYDSSIFPQGKIFKENSKQKGWFCKFCNNFNYEMRKKCNRCLADRVISEVTQYNILNFLNQMKINGNYIWSNPMSMRNLNVNVINRQNNTKKANDWICFLCKNINFPFRIVCNRCHLSKEESDAFCKRSIIKEKSN